MSSSLNNVRRKFGENCINYFFIINFAIFVTPYINDYAIDSSEQILFTLLSFVVLFAGIVMLKEQNKPLPGKWKRVKIRKDTTINIEEE